MRLLSVSLVDVPPFGDMSIPFTEDDGSPRSATVLLGGGGVGKTTFIGALAATRPGHATTLSPRPSEHAPHAIVEWLLGADDPERPHPLIVASPTARVLDDDQAESMRRREQALFDKVAREGGYAFVAIPSTRWFSRQAIGLSAPARTVARYDVRSSAPLEDASRSDLARETKQALAYAAITRALGEQREAQHDYALLGNAMTFAVNTMVGLAGFAYEGLDPGSFEPIFRSESGQLVPFDGLPTRARHLTALAALPVRALWGAYPGTDPLGSEGVVAVDEVELHQDLSIHGQLVSTLRRALPGVQWVLTATSPLVTSGLGEREIFALRRLPNQRRVELYAGPEARLH